MIPSATYRLQFHKDFTFVDAIPLAPYLARLGVSHVYSSPVGTARAGSTHGYDQVDPTVINPELGGEAGFRALVAALKAEGLGVILDIVPNHMAVGQADNRWWLDVLKNGTGSRFAELFDIDWNPADPVLQGKVLAPFLGEPYAEALEGGALALKRDRETGELAVWAYGSHKFPLRAEDQEVVGRGEDPAARFDAANPKGRARLHELLERQHFRLAWWRTAGDEINWRRFFDITELAGVQVERPEVFELIHALPLRLYAEGLIDGVRCDHVDGLADPAAYCRRLRASLAEAGARRSADAPPGPAYVVVEKILAPEERLSPSWETDGTTGYDYMNESAALLHDGAGKAVLSRLWADISGRIGSFEEEARQARLETLRRSFSGQLEAAVRAFHSLARSDLSTRDLTAGSLRRALTVLLSVFPAYRSYGVGDGGPASDGALLQQALDRAAPLTAPGEGPVQQRIAAWLKGDETGDPELRRGAVQRFQQLSAPVAAKAVEDTAFYRYGRLISRDDVGSDPARLSASVEHMHAANAERARTFPNAMLTTATHDHKRGEDVRARLAVLSAAPDAWEAAVRRWMACNEDAAAGIDAVDSYPLYQTLVGAWPLGLSPDDGAQFDIFRERVDGWWRKAVREAKLNSSWVDPDEAYEERCSAFLERILDSSRSAGFLTDLSGFVGEIAPAGAVNGLVQALLRCTAPGTPDLYQGCEFWDFSLVDPDNRRAVDFASRAAGLDEDASFADLLAHWPDGRIKQRVITCALNLRRRLPEVFAGGYEPLAVGTDVFAFMRRAGEQAILVAAPLHTTNTSLVDGLTIRTHHTLQQALSAGWHKRSGRSVLTGEKVGMGSMRLFRSAPIELIEISWRS